MAGRCFYAKIAICSGGGELSHADVMRTDGWTARDKRTLDATVAAGTVRECKACA
jgi:hypothetical protein